MDAIEKIRKARQLEVKIGECSFTCQRATLEQAMLYSNARTSDAEVCRRHVIGWSGVKGTDLMPELGKDLVNYDQQLFNEIIGEKIDWWNDIAKEVLESARQRLEKRRDNEKK